MSKFKKTLVIFLIGISVYVLSSIVPRPSSLVYAAIPHLINYQGRLTDKSGKPLEGSYALTFRIYDAETAGTQLWEETHSGVVIQKGVFSVLLGSVTNFNLTFSNPYFLEIKVGSEVMAPRQRITSAGYAMRAENAGSADTLTSVLPTSKGGTAVTTNANSPNGVVVLDASGYVPDNSVDTGALKTAISGFAHTSPQGYALYVVTGGSYCFYPQTHMSSSDVQAWRCNIVNNEGSFAGWTNYATYVSLSTGSTGVAMYVQFRYITSSGADYWLWILLDKSTKDMLAISAAPDHPAYGNGGDFDKLPHPFRDFDPNTQEIVLIDQDTCKAIRQFAKDTGKSVLELVNNEYKVDFSEVLPYTPLHSGKYIDENGKQIKEMVNSIPDYMKVRRLIKMTNEEKDIKVARMKQKENEYKEGEIKKENKLNALKNKLHLTDEEFEVFKESLR